MAPSKNRWPEAPLLLGALAALLCLALAHASEIVLGLKPCELCLAQRQVYWIAAGVALALAVAVRLRPRFVAAALLILAVCFLAQAALAAYHAGVEWRWWPGPARCASGGGRALTTGDMQALLSGKQEKVVQCDVAAIRIAGLSMAGWNAITALGLSIACLVGARTWSRQ